MLIFSQFAVHVMNKHRELEGTNCVCMAGYYEKTLM